MFYKAEILVTLKPEVKDSKAQVLEQIIKRKEFAQAPICHVGKYFKLKIEAPNAIIARESFEKIANEILANPIIEEYKVIALEESDENTKTQSGNYCLSGN